MQYSTTEGSQGICPVNSHIPSDNDWKILEMQLGMTQGRADGTGWRGNTQGTQLKAPSSSSGLDMTLAGYRYINGSFSGLASNAYLWSSTESVTTAWECYLNSGYVTAYRGADAKADGFSVRCLAN